MKLSESIERLNTIAFDHGTMAEWIKFDRMHARIDVERWHNEIVPACYRDRVAEIALVVFEQFKGRNYSDDLLVAFIAELRRSIFQHLEPIAPAIGFHRTHDEWPS